VVTASGRTTPTSQRKAYGCGDDTGPIILGQQTGVILHQPLSLQIFRKNTKNGQKMNGIPVSPGEKTENAPTWRPRCHEIRTYFWPNFMSFSPPIPHPNPHITFFLFLDPNKTHPYYHLGKASTPTHRLLIITQSTNIQRL